MELNSVPKAGLFGNVVDVVNSNFAIVRVAIGNMEYATSKNKGMFATAQALSTAIPSPKQGDWALVGTSFPAAVYSCQQDGVWADSGSTYDGGSVALNDYLKLSDFNEYKANGVLSAPTSIGSASMSTLAMVVLTQAAYEALQTKDSNTLYFIKED